MKHRSVVEYFYIPRAWEIGYFLIYLRRKRRYSTDINERVSTSCQNNATCVDSVNMFMCDCVPGYTGTGCQTGMHAALSRKTLNLNEWKVWVLRLYREILRWYIHVQYRACTDQMGCTGRISTYKSHIEIILTCSSEVLKLQKLWSKTNVWIIFIIFVMCVNI